MLPVGIEVVGACAAEPIDAEQAAAVVAALAPTSSTVCCPADTAGSLTVYDLSGSPGLEIVPVESAAALLSGLDLQPVRAQIAVSVDTGNSATCRSLGSAIQSLNECHLYAGSSLIPPGEPEPGSTTVGTVLTTSSPTVRHKGKNSTVPASSADVRNGLYGFAGVKLLLPLAPAPDYGSAALQVRQIRCVPLLLRQVASRPV